MKNTFITKQRETRQLHELPKGKVFARLGSKGNHLSDTGHRSARSRLFPLMLTGGDGKRLDSSSESLPALFFCDVCYLTRDQAFPVGTNYTTRGQAVCVTGAESSAGSIYGMVLSMKFSFWGQELWRGGPGAPRVVGASSVHDEGDGQIEAS